MSTAPPPNPLFALTPDQLNWAETAQWRQIVNQALADARFAIPAFLTEDMDATTQTCRVQVALQERVRTSTGPAWQDVPPIILVPVLIPRGGGFSMTLPLKKNSEGLLIFCDACIDNWWNSGQSGSVAPTTPSGAPVSGSQRQNEVRRHYVHDCGFYPTSISQPNKLTDYSTDSLQIRADDGSAYVDVTENLVTLSGADEVDVVAPVVNISAGTGTPLALVNDTFYQWYVTNIQPFLVGLGYSGPPIPTGSETTILKAL